jgi:uncharacterized protein (AIM24 family)
MVARAMEAHPPSSLPARLSDPNAPNLSAQVPGSYELRGEIAQTVTVALEQGQAMWASKGAILAHDQGVRWQLKIPGAAVSRMLSGEGLAMTYITSERPGARVVLSANQTGKIAVWDLRWGPVTCTSGAFLGALGDVKIDVTVARRFGAALFGGAGFLLQRLSGTGLVFIHGAGDFVERDLQPGEAVTVSTGNLAAFGSGVGYDIVGVGGCLKILFGREGLFMTRMTGPGRVLLQSMKRLRLQARAQ